MDAAAGQAEHHIAGADAAAVDDFGFFHYADGETGEIVLARGIHSRHLGSLAADQRASGLLAAGGDAFYHFGSYADVELAAGEVIEKQQRLRALHQDVIHAHRNQVDADGVVPVQLKGKLELGADAVSSGNQPRLAIPRRNFQQPAEAADTRQHLGTQRLASKRLDVLD